MGVKKTKKIGKYKEAYNAPLTKPHKWKIEKERRSLLPCLNCGKPSISENQLCSECFNEACFNEYIEED